MQRHTANEWGAVRRWLFASVAVLGLITACGGPPRPPPKQVETTVSGRCPVTEKTDVIATFDFAREFALSREAADSLKAAALTAVDLAQLADRLDADLGIACAQLAHDLGDQGDWRSGSEACEAAAKAIAAARANVTLKGSPVLVTRAPVCAVDTGVMTKCVSLCDSMVTAERSRVECPQRVGRCDGQCGGACEAKGSVRCDGVCSGVCEGTVKGKCGGRCRGTCDGKTSSGACAGTCAGTCDRGPMVGTCAGTCAGACAPSKPGICDAQCLGSCNVELADARCSGEPTAPGVSNDCRARCQLAVVNQTECTAPPVGLVLPGARDDAGLKTAVDKAFPALLKALNELGPQGADKIAQGKALVDRTRGGFKELAQTGGPASVVSSEEQLKKCFGEPFEKASALADLIKVELDRAAAVRDEATK